MNLEILFEDQVLVAVNKPAGVVVNRAQTVSEATVQDWMEKKLKSLEAFKLRPGVEEFVARSGVVHRLDKETSGVLLLAKTPTAFDRLKAQFALRQVAKEYLALVHGQLQPKQGTINLPIARHPYDRRRFAVRLGGRSAATAYHVRRYYRRSEDYYTLVEARPTTGRTHQIRVHLQFLKHPLVADPRYLSGKQQGEDRQWCPRLFLHAQSLSFTHPATSERLTLTAPLASDLTGALQGLSPGPVAK